MQVQKKTHVVGGKDHEKPKIRCNHQSYRSLRELFRGLFHSFTVFWGRQSDAGRGRPVDLFDPQTQLIRIGSLEQVLGTIRQTRKISFTIKFFLKRSIEYKPQPEDILPLGVVHSHFSFTAVEIKCGLAVDEAIVK